MPPALSALDVLELRRLIPLNTLSTSRFEQLCSQIQIEQAPRDSVLFQQGETRTEFVYLLSGTISLQAGGVEMDSISGGTDTARFALAHQIPRKVSAVAKDTVRYVRIKPEVVNQQEELRQGTAAYKVSDIPEEPTRDWMTALLKSPIFQRLSPANMQAVLRTLEEIEVKAGDVICHQGDPGDFYYIIKKGRCVLTRKPSRLGKEIKLATLKTSDTFGEDSLISGDPRNVTVTMLTDGLLLRLDKASFLKQLKDPVISHVDMETAQRMASQDAVWLDVRSPDIYEHGHLPGSLNIPFFSLRMMLPTLNRQSKYLLVCENGLLSETAAFLLMRYSFEAHVLAGGIGGVPRDHLVIEAPKSVPSSALVAAAYSNSETGQPDLTLQILEEETGVEASQIEEPEETQNSFGTLAIEMPEDQESEPLGLLYPRDQTPTLDALLAAERKENQGTTESMQPAVRESQDLEDHTAALPSRLQELEATVQEGVLRERNLAQRLTASENTAAEAISQARALKEQLTKAGDIIASVASISEKRQQAEERLQKAQEEIDALKTELERVREAANDRETALRSLRENHERLLAEKHKNTGVEKGPGDNALSALQQEIEQLKALNLQAISDKEAAERQAEDLARQVTELQTVTDEFIEHGANTADEDMLTLRSELDMVRRQAADDLTAMQTRLRDVEEERSKLGKELQTTRQRLTVLEAAASAARAADADQRKRLRSEFAAALPVTVAIALFLTALVLGGLFGTGFGRNFLSHWLEQTSQLSPQASNP